MTGYLVFIGVWAAPLILIQWMIGLDILLSRWKVWLLAILLPTGYLCLVYALGGRAAWQVNNAHSGGALLPLLNIPLEEALLYFVCNTLIVQTFILSFYVPNLRARIANLWTTLRRRP
ncbi:MAG: hypothetical protein IAE83_21020 [Anaerolinea sp.]|nr:hypothetical protein [Anaerolinea sp.]MCC6976007.1 hypothetical protein [Anaerolineae bacterium]CAG0979239.1 hypothetical protein ANRL4_01763 [Anaerolineae bacterium]